jgi:hypothetical protein
VAAPRKALESLTEGWMRELDNQEEVCDPLGPDRAEKALEGLDDGKTTRQSNPARCAKFEWTAVPDRGIVKPWETGRRRCEQAWRSLC